MPSVEIPALRSLHKSMLTISLEMQQFRLNLGAATFDCLFSKRDEPFVLALTSVGRNAEFVKFDVKAGYRIDTYLGDLYGPLVRALFDGGPGDNPLMPRDFLQQLNGAIPQTAHVNANPSNREIMRLRSDVTEDRDKPFFDAWIYWGVTSRRRPTAENLSKTQVFLGRDAVRHSQRNNASSRWSQVDKGVDWRNA